MKQKNVEYQLAELEAGFTARKTGVEDAIRNVRKEIANQQKEHDIIIAGLKVQILELEIELSGVKREYTRERMEIMKGFVNE